MDEQIITGVQSEIIPFEGEAVQQDPVSLKKIDRFSKSNFLISGKYESPIMSSRILAVAMSQIQHARKNKNGQLVCAIPSTELKKIIPSSNSGSFYEQLKVAAALMPKLTMGYSDDEHQRFSYIAVVTNCDYENGTIYITFNHDIGKYLVDLKDNFTVMKLSQLMKFRRNYSFRLYEICRSHCYYAKNTPLAERDGHYRFSYSVNELKFMIGVLDISDDKVMRFLNKTNPDYDKAAELVSHKKLEKWDAFRRGALIPAVNEINEKSDIHVEFSPVTRSPNRSVVAIDFDVSFKAERTEKKEVPEISMKDMDKIAKAITEITLMPSEINTLYRDAGGDVKLVISKCKLLSESMKTQKIENPVAWLRTAIKKNFLATESTEHGLSYKKDLYIDPETDEVVDISTLPPSLRRFAESNYIKKYPEEK